MEHNYFFVIDLTIMKDGTTPSAAYVYASESEAYAAYYSTISSKYSNVNVDRSIVKLVSDAGYIMEEGGYNLPR